MYCYLVRRHDSALTAAVIHADASVFSSRTDNEAAENVRKNIYDLHKKSSSSANGQTIRTVNALVKDKKARLTHWVGSPGIESALCRIKPNLSSKFNYSKHLSKERNNSGGIATGGAAFSPDNFCISRNALVFRAVAVSIYRVFQRVDKESFCNWRAENNVSFSTTK